MLKNDLAPYILVSVMIHTGLLFGMHSFLSLPDTQLEPPVLIPVEMVVIRKQPPAPLLRITASEPMAAKKQESIARSQLAVDMYADQGSDDIADPLPAEDNYQSSVNLDTNGPILVIPMASKRPKPSGQIETALSQPPPLHLFPADEQLYEVLPSPKKVDSAPTFTAGTMPTPRVPHTTPKGDEVASEPVNLASQKTSLDLSAAEPSSPAWSTPSGMSVSADLAEANATASSHFFQVPHTPVTSLVDTPTGDVFVAELLPLPEQVEGEPRLMASTLQINGHPDGAQVYVDGMLGGDTPLDMELTLGKHEVRVALPDHYDWKAQVELTETNQSIPISFRLLPVE